MLKNIIIGWFNWFFKRKEKWMIDRKNICEKCPKNKCGMCTECGCVINAKVCVKSAYCPIGKWSSVESENDVIDDLLKRWKIK